MEAALQFGIGRRAIGRWQHVHVVLSPSGAAGFCLTVVEDVDHRQRHRQAEPGDGVLQMIVGQR